MAHFDDAQSPVLDFRRYRPMASHLAAAAIGAFILYGAMTHVGSTELMIRETLAVHTRAMMSEQVEQVASSDQHTVKPWFAGRLPFSPPVNDVLPAEYPLIGGRVESLNAKPAAVVVYGRRKHRIALFMQPVSASAISPMDISRDGYNMLSWRDRDFAYLAVSDLNVVEFKEFIGRLR